MRLAIVGSRTFDDWELMLAEVDAFCQRQTRPVTAIVTGGARGADSLARRYSLLRDLELREFPAQWKTYGKSAGFRRNKSIVDDADAVLVFFGPDGESKGASLTLGLAQESGKTWAVYYA